MHLTGETIHSTLKWKVAFKKPFRLFFSVVYYSVWSLLVASIMEKYFFSMLRIAPSFMRVSLEVVPSTTLLCSVTFLQKEFNSWSSLTLFTSKVNRLVLRICTLGTDRFTQRLWAPNYFVSISTELPLHTTFQRRRTYFAPESRRPGSSRRSSPSKASILRCLMSAVRGEREREILKPVVYVLNVTRLNQFESFISALYYINLFWCLLLVRTSNNLLYKFSGAICSRTNIIFLFFAMR